MIRVDARGMRCPWPAVRLARALRGGATAVEVIADDPNAPAELAATATAMGAICRDAGSVGASRFVVTRPPINAPFTLAG